VVRTTKLENYVHQERAFIDIVLRTFLGFNEPDSALVLEKDSSPRGYKMTMFVAPKNANIEMWEGPRTGIEAAKEVFGADEVILPPFALFNEGTTWKV